MRVLEGTSVCFYLSCIPNDTLLTQFILLCFAPNLLIWIMLNSSSVSWRYHNLRWFSSTALQSVYNKNNLLYCWTCWTLLWLWGHNMHRNSWDVTAGLFCIDYSKLPGLLSAVAVGQPVLLCQLTWGVISLVLCYLLMQEVGSERLEHTGSAHLTNTETGPLKGQTAGPVNGVLSRYRFLLSETRTRSSWFGWSHTSCNYEMY